MNIIKHGKTIITVYIRLQRNGKTRHILQPENLQNEPYDVSVKIDGDPL